MTLQILKVRKKPMVADAILVTAEGIDELMERIGKRWCRKAHGTNGVLVGISIRSLDILVRLGDYVLFDEHDDPLFIGAREFSELYDVIEASDDLR